MAAWPLSPITSLSRPLASDESRTADELPYDHRAGQDSLLEFFVWTIENTDDLELQVTLALPAGVLTGTAVNQTRFLELLAEQITEIGEAREFAKAALVPDSDDLPGAGRHDRAAPNVMHLRDARFVSAAGAIPVDRGMVFRVKLSEVSGFTIGELEFDSDQ